MQKLKQELKDKIVVEAKKAFLSKGFNKASMRDIAKASGITVGNVYRYFKNKDELFYAVVGEAHVAITHIVESDHSGNVNIMNAYDLVTDDDYMQYVDPALNQIIDVFVKYKEEVNILVYKSEGSELGMMINELKQVVVDKIYNQVLNGNEKSRLDLYGLAQVLANASIEGITRVCKSNLTDEEIYRNIFGQLMFLFMGTQGRIQHIEMRMEGGRSE